MSVSIRLSRTGRKNLPSYRVVVTQTRTKRDGKVLDIIGHFNPSSTPISFEIDKKKFQEWIEKGAIASESVKKLAEGKYEYLKYKPKKEEKKPEASKEMAVAGSEIPAEMAA